MAAYAALVSLMYTIEQFTNHPRFSTSLDNNEIQLLREKAGFLLDMIEANNYGGASIEAEYLERRITSAAHEAEDVIETRIVDQIHAESESSSFLIKVHKKVNYLKKKVKFLKGRIGCAARVAEDEIESDQKSLICSHYLHQIVQHMDAILAKANELKNEEEQRTHSRPDLLETGENAMVGFEEEHSRPDLLEIGESAMVGFEEEHSRPDLLETGESAMVGFEDELIQIMDELTNQRTSRRTISIVGMGGMGKTTLARNVYQNSLMKYHFHTRAWATVSQHDVSHILSQLLYGDGKFSNRSVDALGEKLHKTLYGRRYLIILDDIWSVEIWDEVRHFFPDNGNGSRILLTTRLSNVANNCSSSSFTMNLLDEDKSWELFCKKTFKHESCRYPELEETGKKIVGLCKGLPLSIVVVGGSLLKSPRTLEHWKGVALNIGKQESFDVLISSYNHLPAHLRPCFLHIGVYNHPFFEIHVSKTIKLWVAEGFIKPNGTRVLEEIARDYLKDLTDRNLIFVSRRHVNGRMKCFKMHDLLRDLCLRLADQQEFFCVTDGLIIGTERRLIIIDTSVTESVRATTLARSFTASEVDKQELDKHKLLRILDASNHELSEDTFRSVNLRYLAMAQPNAWASEGVWELPTSLSLLWNLHTLIFGYFWMYKRVIAPIEVWKMRQLRHINCPKMYLPHPCQHGMSVLENLQELKTLVNFRLSKEVCKLIPNIKNLHLVYDRYFQGYDDSLIQCLGNLSQLHTLESLNLKCGTHFPIWNSNLNNILTFPSSLNKLTLSHCQLHWDDLTKIGSLPLLEVLKLCVFSVTEGDEWSPVNHQFLRLKFLQIEFCMLSCWNAESHHFPVLEKLVLSGLSNLKEVPSDIGKIPTLKLIWIDHACSFSSIISAVRIKEDQIQCQGDDVLQIEFCSFDPESYAEMMQAEGLSTDYVTFKQDFQYVKALLPTDL